MREEIKIPTMGESITEATIGSFLKESGASVREGEEIIELETEKVNQVLYAPIAGTVTWSVTVGDTVKIGQSIGSVEGNGGASQEKKAEEKKPSPSPGAPQKPEIPTQEPKSEGKGSRIMQAEFVAQLKATPPVSPQEIGKEEVSEVRSDGHETRRPMSKIRKVIAQRLVNALQQSAMLTTFNEVDMSAVMELRAKHKESFPEKHGVKLGFMSFFVKAVVEGLKAFPDINSYIDGEEIVQRHYYNIGIAVSTEKGLIVPVIRDCERLTFAEIEKKIADAAKKGKEGKLSINEMQGGGFTITNGGVFGSLLSTPILNPPQVGILGMHNIVKRAVVVNDQIVIRPMMYLALSYDHRIVDGKEAISFLVRVKEVLEDPSGLLFSDG